jgi:iron complex transport system ATP-binding protein
MTLAVNKLTLKHGSKAVLSDLSATFPRGKVSVILGPNGAGKTSLIRSIVGLMPPASGEVMIEGQPLAALPLIERARRIGYLPQDSSPAWNVTVRELIGLGRLPHRSRFAGPSEADEAAIDAALAATDTSTFAARTVDALSGGERARVMLARVLAGEPEWLIADEPLANLDPAHQLDVLALLRAQAFRGTGVIAVLHDLTHAARVADHIILLTEGRLVAAGTVNETLTAEAIAKTFGVGVHIGRAADGSPLIIPLARAR